MGSRIRTQRGPPPSGYTTVDSSSDRCGMRLIVNGAAIRQAPRVPRESRHEGFADRFADIFELRLSKDIPVPEKVINMLLRLEMELASHPTEGPFWERIRQ